MLVMLVTGVIEMGKGLVESAADLVPQSVPRPVAKGGVALGGALVAFWILQKVCSHATAVFHACSICMWHAHAK